MSKLDEKDSSDRSVKNQEETMSEQVSCIYVPALTMNSNINDQAGSVGGKQHGSFEPRQQDAKDREGTGPVI